MLPCEGSGERMAGGVRGYEGVSHPPQNEDVALTSEAEGELPASLSLYLQFIHTHLLHFLFNLKEKRKGKKGGVIPLAGRFRALPAIQGAPCGLFQRLGFPSQPLLLSLTFPLPSRRPLLAARELLSALIFIIPLKRYIQVNVLKFNILL